MQRSRPAAKPRQHARRRAKTPGRNVPLALERFVPFLIVTLANLLARGASRAYARRFGLAIHEWRILAVLGEGRPLSAVEIVRRTAIDKGRVSRAVAGLMRRGLVERESDAFDARRTMLRLSLKGRATYRRIVPLAAARERALLAVLTAPERRQLERLLAKLHERAEAMLAQLGGAPDEDDPAR
jgi:DNA-binding MarR family transcriptional regulator